MTDQPAEHHWLRRYAPLVLWMAFIFFLSTGSFSASNTGLILQPLLRWLVPHISDDRVAFVHFLLRKCAHFTGYAVLGLLAARAFITSTQTRLHRNWFLAALVLVALYAFTDEYHQSFVPSRTGSIYDSFIDIAGGFTALILLAQFQRKRRVRRPDTY
jgi:VanZ family protein